MRLSAGDRVLVISKTRPVAIVCGVVAEYDGEQITMTQVRQAVYYGNASKAYIGLAAIGPAPNSRITPAIAELETRDINYIIRVTPEAWAKWCAEPWVER